MLVGLVIFWQITACGIVFAIAVRSQGLQAACAK